MALSRETIDEAYRRTNNRCECSREHLDNTSAPHHGGRCKASFYGRETWEVFQLSEGDAKDACQIICINCYRLTKAEDVTKLVPS